MVLFVLMFVPAKVVTNHIQLETLSVLNLNFKSFGQGDPVLILHGLFGTLDNWQTIAKKLAEDHTVFIIDQRNHGRSPHDALHDYPSMAEDLRLFMEENWIHRASVIGHSMGGKAAMQFALDYPDMVEKLVVVDISPKAYVGNHHEIFDALLSLDLPKIKSRQDADDHLAKTIHEPGVRLFLMKNLTRRKDGSYALKMNLDALHRHYPDILAAIESEEVFDESTLFIRGGKSKHMTDGDEEMIHGLFPKAEIKAIENAGHWVHADAPNELLEMVREFLK